MIDNIGHGHVWQRPDGVKARCGGPAICSDCAADQAAMTKCHAAMLRAAADGEAKPPCTCYPPLSAARMRG